MQLDERKTYRTRDGSRTGIRVRPHNETWPWFSEQTRRPYSKEGYSYDQSRGANDLVEEQPADRPFSYDACPVGPDGRRRAVTRDGREVVLYARGLARELSIVGMIAGDDGLWAWRPDGTRPDGRDERNYLLVPPPQKRVVWVNLDPKHQTFNTEWAANRHNHEAKRLGCRAHRIEVDP